jgi:BASS family bile acid:Na+ symporter
MRLFDLSAQALAWLGRHGTGAVAASIFLGLAVPPLAAVFKPFVSAAIFLLLMLAFLRVDARELRAHFVEPRLVVLATAWIMLAVPAVLGFAFLAVGLPGRAPDLFVGLMLQASAPPIMAAPAFAALMGLEAALSLAALVLCMAVTPLTAAAFAQLFVGPALPLRPIALGLQLTLILAGSAACAAAIRAVAGKAWVERQRERIDGLSVVLLFVFAVAVMGGVTLRFLAEPLFVIGLLVLSFVLALGLTAATTLAFARAGRGRAFALGLACGHRNLGLMLAATGGVVPDPVWLYFGIAQFPIYLVPQLLKPIAQRLQTIRARSGENA